MKKLRFILAGAIVSTAFCLTGCVYVGLPTETIKRHNQAIKQQLPDFALDNYSGSFYYIPDSKGKSIEFSSKDGEIEYLIKTDEYLTYFDGTSEKTYTFSIRAEENTSWDIAEYQSIDNDIQALLDVVHSHDGKYDRIRSVSGSQQYGNEIYDEIEHDVYSMEWKYAPIALFIFYLNAKTSELHSIYFCDESKDINNDDKKPHFYLRIYPDASFVSGLENKYESLKRA